MNSTHQGTPAWTSKAREAGQELLGWVDNTGTKLGGVISRELDKLGMHELARRFQPSQKPGAE